MEEKETFEKKEESTSVELTARLGVNIDTINGEVDDPFHKRMVISSDPGSHANLEVKLIADSNISDYDMNSVVDRDDVYEDNDVSTIDRTVVRPTTELDGTSAESFFNTFNNKLFGVGFNVYIAPLGYVGSIAEGGVAALTAKLSSKIRTRQYLKQFMDLLPIRSGQVKDLSGSEPDHNKLNDEIQFSNENSYHVDLMWLGFVVRRYNELVQATETLSKARKMNHSITNAFRDNQVRSLMADITDFLKTYGTYYSDLVTPQLKFTNISAARTKNNLGSLSLIHPQVAFSLDAFAATAAYIQPVVVTATNALTLGERCNPTALLEKSLAGIVAGSYTFFDELEALVLSVLNSFPNKHKAVIRFYTNINNKSSAMQEKWQTFGQVMNTNLPTELKVSPLLSRFMEWLPGLVTGADGIVADVIALVDHQNDFITVVDSPIMPKMDFGDYLETFDFSISAITLGDIEVLDMVHTLTGMTIKKVITTSTYLPSAVMWYKDQVASSDVWYDWSTGVIFPIFEIDGTIDVEELAKLLIIRDTYRMKFSVGLSDPGSVGSDNNFLFANRENTLLYHRFRLSNYSPVYPSIANKVLPKDIYANLGKKTFKPTNRT